MAEDPDGLLLSLNADQSASSDGESVLAGEVSPLSTHERPVHPPLPGAGAHVTARLVFLCAVSGSGPQPRAPAQGFSHTCLRKLSAASCLVTTPASLAARCCSSTRSGGVCVSGWALRFFLSP